MPRILLLLCILLGAMVAQAQTPWQGFLPNRVAHYAVRPASTGIFINDSLEAVYEPVRFDSSFSHGPNQFHVAMKSAGTLWWTHNAQWSYPNGPAERPWYGPTVRKDALEEEYFPAGGGSIVLRRNRIQVGDTALVWLSGPGKLYAICTRLDTGRVLTELDSLATLRLAHRDSAGALGAWDGRTLVLSRQHGWVQALNFYWIEGPENEAPDTLYRRLAFLSGSPVDYIYPSYAAWHSYQPGDVMQFTTSRSQGMVAQCWWTLCNTSFAASESVTHHRRLLSRMPGPAGDTLVWLDSSLGSCRVLFGNGGPPPPPTPYPLTIDTVKMVVSALADTLFIGRISMEYRQGPNGSTPGPFLLVRTRQGLRRYTGGRFIEGGGGSYWLAPFGKLKESGSNNSQGQCASGYTLQYATCNGDTLGVPNFLATSSRARPQAKLVTLSPNPTSGMVHLKMLTDRPMRLEILRPDGTMLRGMEVGASRTLDLRPLPPGLYAWRAVQGSAYQAGRMVKE